MKWLQKEQKQCTGLLVCRLNLAARIVFKQRRGAPCAVENGSFANEHCMNVSKKAFGPSLWMKDVVAIAQKQRSRPDVMSHELQHVDRPWLCRAL